ncbi:hypothetical protein R3P38DRAFT_3190488 [Favolaschia claudopus]|uniref:Uncharacterized protein n=1 Tax=Favolaschia claudopus TaxID=2862362 RepID=A0AAW0BM00_9AGAR
MKSTAVPVGTKASWLEGAGITAEQLVRIQTDNRSFSAPRSHHDQTRQEQAQLASSSKKKREKEKEKEKKENENGGKKEKSKELRLSNIEGHFKRVVAKDDQDDEPPRKRLKHAQGEAVEAKNIKKQRKRAAGATTSDENVRIGKRTRHSNPSNEEGSAAKKRNVGNTVLPVGMSSTRLPNLIFPKAPLVIIDLSQSDDEASNKSSSIAVPTHASSTLPQGFRPVPPNPLGERRSYDDEEPYSLEYIGPPETPIIPATPAAHSVGSSSSAPRNVKASVRAEVTSAVSGKGKGKGSVSPRGEQQDSNGLPSVFVLPPPQSRHTAMTRATYEMYKHIVPYFEEYGLDPLYSELDTVLTILAASAKPKHWLEQPFATLAGYDNCHRYAHNEAGAVYVRVWEIAQNLLPLYDNRVRTHPAFNPKHESKQSVIMAAARAQRGASARFGYAGQTRQTLVQRQTGDQGLLSIYRQVAQEMEKEGLAVKYGKIRVFETEDWTQRMIDMGEFACQGLIGVKNSVNFLFMAESFRFLITPELLDLVRPLGDPTTPRPGVAFVLDGPGPVHIDMHTMLKSATLQTLQHLTDNLLAEAIITVIDIKARYGSNSSKRLRPGEAQEQLAALAQHNVAVVCGFLAMEALCDLEVLEVQDGERAGQPLEFGPDLREGQVLNALWTKTKLPIHLGCILHPGHGSHRGAYSEEQRRIHRAMEAMCIVMRAKLWPDDHPAQILATALPFLKTVTGIQAEANEADLADLHTPEEWLYLKEKLLQPLDYNPLAWCHIVRPCAAGEGTRRLVMGNASASATYNDDQRRLTKISAPLVTRGEGVVVKDVNKGDRIQWHFTATHLTIYGESADDLRLKIPWGCAERYSGMWPLFVVATLYGVVDPSLAHQILDDQERTLLGQALIKSRLPEKDLRKKVCAMVGNRLGDLDLIQPWWRLLSPKPVPEGSPAWHRVNSSHAWYRAVGETTLSIHVGETTEVGEALRLVLDAGWARLIDVHNKSYWEQTITSAWNSVNIADTCVVSIGLLMGFVDPNDLVAEPEGQMSTRRLFEHRVPDQDKRDVIEALVANQIPGFTVDTMASSFRFMHPEENDPDSFHPVGPGLKGYHWCRNMGRVSSDIVRPTIFLDASLAGVPLRPVVTATQVQLRREGSDEAVWYREIEDGWNGTAQYIHIWIAGGLFMGLINPEDLPERQPEAQMSTRRLFEHRVPDQDKRDIIEALVAEKIPGFTVDHLAPSFRLIRATDNDPSSFGTVVRRVQRGKNPRYIWDRSVGGVGGESVRLKASLKVLQNGVDLRPVVTSTHIELRREQMDSADWNRTIAEAWMGKQKPLHLFVAAGLFGGVILPEGISSFSNLSFAFIDFFVSAASLIPRLQWKLL